MNFPKLCNQINSRISVLMEMLEVAHVDDAFSWFLSNYVSQPTTKSRFINDQYESIDVTVGVR